MIQVEGCAAIFRIDENQQKSKEPLRALVFTYFDGTQNE